MTYLKPAPLAINTATISQGSFKPSIKAISPLESTTNVTLSPQTDGQVIKKLVQEGKSSVIAVIESAESRLRPILMTTLVALAGFLPLSCL